MSRLRALPLALAMAASVSSARAERAPEWLRAAATTDVGTLAAGAPAVVLLHEQWVSVGGDGRVVVTDRGAVRILDRAGREYAKAAAFYWTDTGKITDFSSWTLRPDGDVVSYGSGRVADLAAFPSDAFNESRIRLVTAEGDAEPGAVFGWEWKLSDRSVFTQRDWTFQSRLPTAVARFGLELPRGWRVAATTFQHAPIEPVTRGEASVWELRNLPWLEEEPASPPVSSLAPRLAVSWFPPDAGAGRSFGAWPEVAAWLDELGSATAQPSEAVTARARELAGGRTGEWEKFEAIARAVRSVNYVSVQIGLGRGGGYRPHAPADVLARGYGDCKDKAHLARAMLAAVGIASWPVAIYSGDPDYVRTEWPSPQQFNHCILAVRLADTTHTAARFRHPTLGTLALFDPTDPHTPIGELPEADRGSLALLVSSEHGALFRAPFRPAEANRLEREADVTLEIDGSIAARLRERSQGRPAAEERGLFLRLDRHEYDTLIERWVNRGVGGASVTRVMPEDDPVAGRFRLEVDFSAPRYGRVVQSRLLTFRPALVSRRETVALTAATRRFPVVIEPQSWKETVRVTLPPGLAVEELPEPVSLATGFGTYEARYEMKDHRLEFHRSLVQPGGTVPPEQYAAVRDFYARMLAAEQTAVVLTRP